MTPIQRLSRITGRQHGLVTRVQAVQAGLTRHQIDGLITTGWVRVVHRGVYRLAGSPRTWHQTVLAACLAAGPDALASHRCAATLWDLPVREAPIELSVPPQRRAVVRGAAVHRVSLGPGQGAVAHAIPVTKPTRTILDAATVLDLDVLEDVVDDAVGRRLVRVDRMQADLEALGRQGRRGAGDLYDLLRIRADMPRPPQSRFERSVLALLRAAGLPEPEVQYPVKLPDGTTIFLDIAWPPCLFAIEADSYRYHAALSAWSRDRVRNNAVTILGWRLMAVTWQDVIKRPAEFAGDVARGLEGSSARAG